MSESLTVVGAVAKHPNDVDYDGLRHVDYSEMWIDAVSDPIRERVRIAQLRR
jgi:hypothetical protein